MRLVMRPGIAGAVMLLVAAMAAHAQVKPSIIPARPSGGFPTGSSSHPGMPPATTGTVKPSPGGSLPVQTKPPAAADDDRSGDCQTQEYQCAQSCLMYPPFSMQRESCIRQHCTGVNQDCLSALLK